MHKTTYTLAEAAELLHCHKETLRKSILDGSLQAARLGRGYRVSRADLQKFWTERGGGELFGKSESLPTAAESAYVKDAAEEGTEKGVGRRRKASGPRQLTLPLD
ncbi:MAG: excisionase family DNA-binding protein [Deltaproteobacteria bacterium]|jgi:excisionase family DNA binding protein|nr:excisionase family DNA-binding protein [Deltaproteobacteria bacterium]